MLTNAAEHVSQPVVVRLDLEDFFASIAARRVYGISRTTREPPQIVAHRTRHADDLSLLGCDPAHAVRQGPAAEDRGGVRASARTCSGGSAGSVVNPARGRSCGRALR